MERVRRKSVLCNLELESFQTKDLAIQARVKNLEELQQEWASACGVAGEEWAFGQIDPPSESIRTRPQGNTECPIPNAFSTWWYVWRAKWTDRALGRKLEKLSKREKLLESGAGSA